MNHGELVNVVAEKTGLPKTRVRDVLNAISQVVTTVTATDKVVLKDLGVFRLVQRAERKGRNPQTGEEIIIPARKHLKFDVAKGVAKGLR